jgi:fumarylacetoacetase
MTRPVDATHDPNLSSWVPSANRAGTDFPIQNLPFGVFAPPGGGPRLGVAIGDQVLDLRALAERGLLAAGLAGPCRAEQLNPLMAAGPAAAVALRARLSTLLRAGNEEIADRAAVLHEASSVRMLLPAAIGDYTDFYASVHHATNVGSMFRPDNPLLPNYKWIPVGYHGRASTIVASGNGVRRPHGQTIGNDNAVPSFGPSRMLDYELEVGFFVGPGNPDGRPLPIGAAGQHVFGLCLLNDWSARDVQKWEYQPLGPFLAKNFATSISPWVVTMEALAPFRVPAFARPEGDPAPLPHLHDAADQREGAIDLVLEVHLCSALMREQGLPPLQLSRGSFKDMYWTVAQMLAHHSSGGCILRPGDLLASGTVSGPSKQNRGCLLELTWRGSEPITLPTGEQRKFLVEGDEVILRGHCARAGAARIGFGECRGIVLPAGEYPRA